MDEKNRQLLNNLDEKNRQLLNNLDEKNRQLLNNLDEKKNNFVMPILYLHESETLKPVTPEDYLKTVDLWNDATGQCVSQNVTLQTLSDNKNNPNMNCKSKSKDPLFYWHLLQYKYKDPSTIPLYHTEQAKQLVDPKTGKVQNYIERNFNTFYGYNIGSWTGIGNHEADIEDFVIHYDLDGNPLRVYAGCHRDVDGVWRNFKDVHTQNGRPLLFVSKGDHGLYFERKTYPRIYCCANDETAEGILWDPPTSILMDPKTPQFDWLNFTGSWGNGHVGSPYTTVDPEIYWNSNNALRRFFNCGSLTPFNPFST
jgi:hypothetical protein